MLEREAVREQLAGIDTRARRCHVCGAWLPDAPCAHMPQLDVSPETRERMRRSWLVAREPP